MNTMRQGPNRWTSGLGGLWIGLTMTMLAMLPRMAQAETFETTHLRVCRSEGSEDLNRWPLRSQDISSCVEKGTRSPTRVRRYVQESALNLWPYVFQPQKVEPLEALPNEENRDRPTTYVRTEPDIRMWPLWPRS